MPITTDQVMRARVIFKESFPKLNVGVRTNGDKGYKLVAKITKEQATMELPSEIDGVPLETQIVESVEKKKRY